jgi:hypothetical protein
MYGGSYAGYTQYLAAPTRPPVRGGSFGDRMAR